MKSVQIVFDEKLLRAADRLARRRGVNRSLLVREAVQEYLRREALARLNDAERRGYLRHPDAEFRGLERLAAWPED